MPAWKRIPFHIDRDPAKPGRTQNWFELAQLEKAMGRPITWVYSNRIAPGKTAGSHYHKEHEVFVWVAEGEMVMHLRDARVDEAETLVLKADSELLLVPADVYHAGGNVSDKDCLVVMFASTKPRDAKDEYFL
jgi:uncharacterized RmlC-like cupin family protein